VAQSARSYERVPVSFPSGREHCAAWLYLPRGESAGAVPVVVMGHGIGATREMGLAPFAEKFVAAGLAVLVFTYRNFGDSGGSARQLISVKSQLQDWESALAFVKTVPQVDTARAAVWGTSFGGGHAITIASRHPELKAAVAQCPFTDGTASAGALSFTAAMRIFAVVARDVVGHLWGTGVQVPIAAAPGQLALMDAPDALPGYNNLLPRHFLWANSTPARSILNIIRYRPGKTAKDIAIPIMFCVSATDTVAPTQPTIDYVSHARLGDVRVYPAGHFDFYLGDIQRQLADEQTEFLMAHLKPSVSAHDRDHRDEATRS
jgi:pimeloyl-ACP methyl ester carboxylesterase